MIQWLMRAPGGVAIDRHRMSRVDLVARFDVVAQSWRITSCQFLGILLVLGRDAVGARDEMVENAERAAKTHRRRGRHIWSAPFHSSTIGLMRGFFGRSA